ncbi:GlsB/YeaQ/YmgE family stress response membrane protein [Streptomyces sp. NPDC004959]|uniref:GlsB/YeaQ/YmgE family stress response membrane protein n=1 Tax=unclassified Streptomyces TaxID=2593676 RepID=UPI0004CADDB8|nr:GlsB/YeaQ/YmgE family stress response membrane protein [Streptomyces sp. NRRL F-5630]
MGWIWAIIVGFVLGFIAKLILPGKQHSPLWLVVAMGTIGGLVGNGIASAFGVRYTHGIDWTRHLFQLIAAIVLVAVGESVYKAVKRDNVRR